MANRIIPTTTFAGNMGSATLTLQVALAAYFGTTPTLTFDTIQNLYTPKSETEINLAAATEYALAINANAAIVIIMPPSGNANSWQFGTQTGVSASRKYVAPTGPIVLTQDPSNLIGTIYLYSTSGINGVQVLQY